MTTRDYIVDDRADPVGEGIDRSDRAPPRVSWSPAPMRIRFHSAFLCLSLVACSSSANAPATNRANPCATRGASYIAHFVEQSGGTCGPMSDQIISVLKDGTLVGPALQCDSMTLDACTARDTNCVNASNGVTCHITVESTFQNDGSAASGSESLSCTQDGRAPCTSTYATTLTRQ